ncbi:hypothetical protein N4R57_19790 [Rhodobacteraceae bacterium D3-12]|nr:hypothetical protein N4R57_19790 [Rhodobacteraceae bacterium D3-12]
MTLTAGTTYRVDVESYSWRTHDDPHLGGIYDSAGTLIAGTTNYHGGEGNDARTYFTPTLDGTYYVSAGVASGVNDRYSQNGYSVRITDNWDDYADDTSTTGMIVSSSFRYDAYSGAGQSDWQGDRDWFAITLEAGQTYSVLVNGDSVYNGSGYDNADGYIYGIYDSTGAYLPGTRDDDSGTGVGAWTEFTATTAGTYYVAAGLAPDSTETTGYQVAIFEDDYTQNTETTGRLTVGGTAGGTFLHDTDRDWFAIDLEAGVDYTFVMTSDSWYGLWPGIHSVRDASGARFANTSVATSLGDKGAIVDFTAPKTAPISSMLTPPTNILG